MIRAENTPVILAYQKKFPHVTFEIRLFLLGNHLSYLVDDNRNFRTFLQDKIICLIF